jgi:zeaxanthin glucosyltransferase
MEGHYFPSFKLAKNLRDRGHEIYYLGLASAEPMVRREGFELVPILQRFLPAGQPAPEASGADDLFGSLVGGEALDGIMGRIKPAAIVMLSINYSEALAVHFAYGLPIVFLTTFCRPSDTTRAEMIEGLIANRLMELKSAVMEVTLQVIAKTGFRFRSFRDLAQVLLRMPELVLLPQAIELPHLADEPQVHYIGTGIDLTRKEEPFPWDAIDAGRYLVYCSLGSHSEFAAAAARRFFHAAVRAAAADPDRQFILSVGHAFDPAELEPVPHNVYLSRWVPQLEVLRRADLMVTHGGAGTVKECILMGVPMIVMPLIRDQFEMAKRIVHHGLGVEGDVLQITSETLGVLIHTVAADGSMKERLAAMRDLVLTADRASSGADVVEAAIAGVPLAS